MDTPDIIIWIEERVLSDGSPVFDVLLNEERLEAITEALAERLAETLSTAINKCTNQTAEVFRA